MLFYEQKNLEGATQIVKILKQKRDSTEIFQQQFSGFSYEKWSNDHFEHSKQQLQPYLY